MSLGKAIYSVGFWIRETGQAIDRLGSRLQGNYLFQEQSTFSLFSPVLSVQSVLPLPLIGLLQKDLFARASVTSFRNGLIELCSLYLNTRFLGC